MASVGCDLEQEELLNVRKEIINQLTSEELVDKFYNGKITYSTDAMEANHIYGLVELLDYPDLLKQAEDYMKNGYKSKITYYLEIYFNGNKLSLKELLSQEWAYMYLTADEEYTWDDVIEDHFDGKKVDPPILKAKIVDPKGEVKNIEEILGFGELVMGYMGEGEELVPVSIELTTANSNGEASRGFEIFFKYGDIELNNFTSVDISTILLLGDLDILGSFLRTEVDSHSYLGYKDKCLYIGDIYDGKIDDIYLEVAPFYKRGYKWSEVHSCKKLTKVILDRLSVDRVFPLGEPTIYKVYMNGNTPEILDCVSGQVILQKDNRWFFKVVIDEILKLNENIGVCYLINGAEYKGSYRARKDKATGEYVITVW